MSTPRLLQGSPLFFEIHDKEVSFILDHCTVNAYQTGSTIFNLESASDQLYILIEGQVELRGHIGQMVKNIETLNEGDIFGESVLSDEKFRSLEAIAISETHVLEITYDSLVQIFNKRAKVFGLLMLNISRLLSKRLLKSQDTIFQIAELTQTFEESVDVADFKAKIFILEDDSDIREILTFYLDKEFEVFSFQNPAEALEALEALNGTNLPDLFVSDYMMPEMNGVEFVEILKEENVNRPVVFVTGVNEYEMAKEAMNLGVHYLLEKPVEKTQLLRTVKTALTHHLTVEFNQLLLSQYQSLFTDLANVLNSANSQKLAEKLRDLIKQSHHSYRTIAMKKKILDSFTAK